MRGLSARQSAEEGGAFGHRRSGRGRGANEEDGGVSTSLGRVILGIHERWVSGDVISPFVIFPYIHVWFDELTAYIMKPLMTP